MTAKEILIQLDVWIKVNEDTAQIFLDQGLKKEAGVYINYSQAYWNVKQLISVNTEKK